MATANIFDLADVWNSGGTTFTAIKMDVTDTASAAGSKLLDLLVGGASKFSVAKDGAATASGLTVSGGSVTLSGNISAAAWTTSGIRFKGVAATLTDTSSSGTVAAAYTNVYGGNTIAASSAATYTDYITTHISQPTAGTNVTMTNRWALGLSGGLKASGQSLTGSQAQSLVDLAATWNTTGAPTALKLDVTDTASGSGSLLLDLLVGGTSRFKVAKTGTVTASTGTVTASTPLLDLAQTWNGTGVTFTGLKVNVTDTASASASMLFDFQVGGTSKAFVRKDGAVAVNSLTGTASVTALDLAPNTSSAPTFRVSSGGVNLRDGGVYAWASSSTISASTDLTLARDAADTLAQRRTTNAQTARIYNTFTDASNYERGKLEWASNVLRIGTEKAGTGSARALELQTDGTTRVTVGASGGVTLTGGTVTASTPLIDATQTWNASGTTFTGIKANVTDTASATGSLLMDLQVGGTSQLNVKKDGQFSTISGLNLGQSSGTAGTGQVFLYAGAGTATALIMQNGSGTVRVSNAGAFQFHSGGNVLSGSSDVFLTRRAAANLRLGASDAAAPVAQTFSVQSVVAGTSNTAGVDFTVTGSQGTGTGAGGSIIFQTAPAGSSGTAQNALSTALAISSAGLLQFAGTTSSFPALKRSSTTVQARLADDSGYATVQGKLQTDANAVSETITATHTLTLYDAAGTAYKVPCVAA